MGGGHRLFLYGGIRGHSLKAAFLDRAGLDTDFDGLGKELLTADLVDLLVPAGEPARMDRGGV